MVFIRGDSSSSHLGTQSQPAQGLGVAVPADALSSLFSLLKDDIRCVVLNACYSADQAEAIAQEIDCVNRRKN